MVLNFTDAEIAHLAAESEEVSAERLRCSKKLAILQNGLKDLRRLDRHYLAKALKIHDLHPEINGDENNGRIGGDVVGVTTHTAPKSVSDGRYGPVNGLQFEVIEPPPTDSETPTQMSLGDAAAASSRKKATRKAKLPDDW